MASHTSINSRPHLVSFPVAIAVTLAMAVVYTAIDMLQFPEPLQSLLSFIPGGVSLIALSNAGLARGDLYLRLAPISRPGLAALAAATLLLLPILGSNTGWIGFQLLPTLVFAPASGVAQELFFRSSLLPGLERAFGNKRMALLVQAAIFVGFHFRTFRAMGTSPIILITVVVLFLAGCAWGWQVQRDRTVAWAMVQHSLFLMLMSMFAWA